MAGSEKIMEDPGCKAFVETYLGSLGLVVGAAVLIAVVNFALKALLTKVVRFERHVSATSENASLMMKIFIAQPVKTFCRTEQHFFSDRTRCVLHSYGPDPHFPAEGFFGWCLGRFLNTCMLVIVTNAKLPPVLHDWLSWMTSLGLFNGAHEEFDARWYIDVAAALTLAMVRKISHRTA